MAVGRVALKRSFSCEAWKWRAVGTRREVSREPWRRVRGRREALDRGVETPVWGPVPAPYMMAGFWGIKGACESFSWPANGASVATLAETFVGVFFSSSLFGQQQLGNQSGLPICDSVYSAKSRRQLFQDAPGRRGGKVRGSEVGWGVVRVVWLFGGDGRLELCLWFSESNWSMKDKRKENEKTALQNLAWT